MNFMEKNAAETKKAEKKGWFGRFIEKLDKKMEVKARENFCCEQKNPKKGSSCC